MLLLGVHEQTFGNHRDGRRRAMGDGGDNGAGKELQTIRLTIRKLNRYFWPLHMKLHENNSMRSPLRSYLLQADPSLCLSTA